MAPGWLGLQWEGAGCLRFSTAGRLFSPQVPYLCLHVAPSYTASQSGLSFVVWLAGWVAGWSCAKQQDACSAPQPGRPQRWPMAVTGSYT